MTCPCGREPDPGILPGGGCRCRVEDVFLTPDEWLALKHPGITVMDPDGWRGPNGRPWSDPISEEEFDRRLPCCTIIGMGRAAASEGIDR